MIMNIFIFVVSLYMVIRGSAMATQYAGQLASSFKLSKYTVGFMIVAIISILPETFVAINSALNGMPSFGLATLFGSNIADLTLVFAIIVFSAGRGLKVESKILKNRKVYPFLLLLPLVLGLDGSFSRIEGLALILVGSAFYYFALRNGNEEEISRHTRTNRIVGFLLLLLSMAILLVGAHFTVISASAVAHGLGISPILIGMFIVGLGTTMPELFFSLKSIHKKEDSLAIGDILGTVLADATIVVGILATIQPFMFPQKIIYVTGVFMVIASFMLFRFMNTGRTLTKREGVILALFWLTFVTVEFLINS